MSLISPFASPDSSEFGQHFRSHIRRRAECKWLRAARVRTDGDYDAVAAWRDGARGRERRTEERNILVRARGMAASPPNQRGA